MVPQFRFESTPLLQQHFLLFIIKSKRNHTHPLLESCQKQLTAILSGTKQALWDGFRPWHGRKWIRSIDGFGQGEAGDTTGIPILKNDIPSELKRSSLNSLLYHKTWSGIEDCQDSSKFKRQPTRHPLLLCHPAQPAHLTQLTMVAMTQLTPHPHLPAPLQQPTPRGPVQQVQWSKMSQLTWKHYQLLTNLLCSWPYHAWFMQVQIYCQWNSITQCSKPRCGIRRCTTFVYGPSVHTAISDHKGTHCLQPRRSWCPCGMLWAHARLGSSSPKSGECHPSSICHAIHSSAMLRFLICLSKASCSKTMFKTHEAIETIDVTWKHTQNSVCLLKANQFKTKTLRKLHCIVSLQRVIHSERRPLPEW